MPLIRKKTSKRGTTNKRARIKAKVAESRKKQKRDAKKNVQWKSKHKKDPGIPNNFPYKDQILAEVAEQRRQAAEEKQRRKEEKKAVKAGVTAETGPDAQVEDRDEQIVFDGIGSVKGHATSIVKGKGKLITEEDVDMEEAPILINHELPNLRSILDQADVVLQILDARDPLAFRSSHIEELATAKPGRQIIFILNKIDTVPREITTLWLTYLRKQHPTLLFRSSSAFLPATGGPSVKSKGKEKPLVNDAVGAKSILAYLLQLAGENGGTPLIVAVVGLTNAGKTSFINSLLEKPLLPIYTLASSSLAPTTTSLPQEVTLDASGKQIRLIDTPGLSWLPSPDESALEHDDLRARDILLRNKGRIDRLKDPTFALEHVVSRANTEDLMLFYNLPAFAKSDTNAFLSGVARLNGMVKKGGAPDLTGAARLVLRDWSVGKFPRFAPAPAVQETSSLEPTSPIAEFYNKDEEILATLKTRKEMRKSTGLVKLAAGHIESRKADVEAGWTCLENEEAKENQDDGNDEMEGSDEGDDEDENEDGDGNASDDDSEGNGGESDEELVTTSPGKRKRSDKQATAPAHPNKKVAFAADPKESKQARATAGLAKKKISSIQKPKLQVPSKLKTSRAANVSSEKKSTSLSKGGEEVYDFGKFF